MKNLDETEEPMLEGIICLEYEIKVVQITSFCKTINKGQQATEEKKRLMRK